jgi:hypothetical protein
VIGAALFVVLFLSTAAASAQQYRPVGEVLEPDGSQFTVRAVAVSGSYLYLLERDGGLHTYDLSSLSDTGTFQSFATPIKTLELQNGQGLIRSGNYLYVFGFGGIVILDVEDPGDPVVINSVFNNSITNMVLHDDMLVGGGSSVLMYSLADPTAPSFVGSYGLGSGNRLFSVAVYESSSDYLYVGQTNFTDPDSKGLRILDVTDPGSISNVDFVPDGVSYHLRVIGDRLVATGATQGIGGSFGFIKLWSLADPGAPLLLDEEAAPERVCAVDRTVIVTNGMAHAVREDSLEAVQQFSPEGEQTDGFPYGSAVDDRFVYLGQSSRILILEKWLFGDGFESGSTSGWSSARGAYPEVTLASGEGFDFSDGTVGPETHGDFYFLHQSGLSEFWANNEGMQGIVGVGLTSDPLEQIDIPEDGYETLGVGAVAQHAYVAKAEIGEPDTFIVFRVLDVDEIAVTLEYLLLQQP